MPTLYTIGHATRPVAELVHLLRQNNVSLLIDVRTLPKSGTNPQFNKDTFSLELPSRHGIRYRWMGKELGGLRKRDKSSELNAGWDNASFRGYADYMQSREFSSGLQQLIEVAEAEGPVAIMCAETVYWQCHRSLISDALEARGWQVLHVISKDKPPYRHKLTKFAKIEGERVTYPAYDHSKGEEGSAKKSGGKHSGAADDPKQPRIDAFFKQPGGQKRAQPEAPS